MREHLRHLLHLVKDCGRFHGVEESLRVGPEPRHHVGVFEQKVASPGKKPAQQHRLSGPARTGEHQSRKVANGFHHLLFQVSADIFYE